MWPARGRISTVLGSSTTLAPAPSWFQHHPSSILTQTPLPFSSNPKRCPKTLQGLQEPWPLSSTSQQSRSQRGLRGAAGMNPPWPGARGAELSSGFLFQSADQKNHSRVFCFFFCRGAEAKEIVLLFQGKADLCLPGAPGRILGRALLETSELSLGSAWGGPTSPEVPCEPGCEEEGWKMGFPPHHRGWTLSVAPQRLR